MHFTVLRNMLCRQEIQIKIRAYKKKPLFKKKSLKC